VKLIISIMSVIALLGAFFASFQWVENRYALREALAQVKQQVDYHIINQQREVLEQRLDKLNEKYKGKPMPAEAKEMKKDLEIRLQEKEKELKSLEKK